MASNFLGLGLACAFASILPLLGCGESKSSGRDDGGEGGDDGGNGATGSGGKSGNTSNLYVGQIRQTGVDKVDLLFMIDNSISMADKQRILARAVPLLLQRLIQPSCVNASGQTLAPSPNGDCPSTHPPEFRAVENIHIGIVTSSLGHHGSNDVCSDSSGGRTPDDLAQLLPSVRPSVTRPLPSWNGQGFLVWDPRGPEVGNAHVPPGWGAPGGPGDAQNLVEAFTAHVGATGELGCGYEQQLESWYRFLVDPEPVAAMGNDGANSVRNGVNQVVLDQRAAFLRRDSLLAIVMLTDENDCSILDENGTQGWLVGFKGGLNVNNWRMPAATNSCKQNPNDACCRPCIVGPAPACGDNAAEGCPETNYLPIADDSMNQRCHNQVQRFGINLLYPTSRYVDAITKTSIDPRLDGRLTPNPLYAPGPLGEPGRDPGLVLLAGIVGVPWQDIASDGNVPVPDGSPQPPNSLIDARALVYLSAGQLRSMGRWDVILGEPSGDPPIAPLDPLMIESIDPRPAGLPHPLGYPGGDIVLPGGNQVNAINGREQAVDPATRDDLQFACIFPLENEMPCDATNTAGCDCNADEAIKQSPLCDYRNGSTSDGVQVNAKAYPSVRELEVLRGVEDAGIVASICPKNVTAQGAESEDPYFGYNPFVSAIVGRMKEALTARCLPRPLDSVTAEDVDLGRAPPEDLGTVPCVVVESRPAGGNCAPCDSPGRREIVGGKLKVVPAVKDYLFNQGQCGDPPLQSCDDYCMCEIQQFAGAELLACMTQGTAAGLNGYCYVDPAAAQASAEADGSVSPVEQDLIDGSSALVASCKETERRVLRFLGDNLPDRGALTTLVCSSASVND